MKHERVIAGEQRLSGFHQSLDQKILEAGLSYRELSAKIGRSENYISTMMRNRNDPGLSTVFQICEALGIRVADLVDVTPPPGGDMPIAAYTGVNDLAAQIIAAAAEQAKSLVAANRGHPTIDELIEWWHRHRGRLEEFEGLRDRIDLFAPPNGDATLPIPVRIGSDSLVARKFSLKDASQLRRLLLRMESNQTKRIAGAHRQALEGQPVLSIEKINLKLPESGQQVDAEYKRLLLPVHDARGHSLVLNYSQLIS